MVLDHDALFDVLGELSMAVRRLDAVAALTPLEAERIVLDAARSCDGSPT
ncbi:hypothetical protein ACH4RA_17845 [Streptomyces smyrnaeus]|nr:hypothetical protein [Streptomyces sp. B15]MBQ1124246.1 hypothetical protein [Streptomyces sp. B15]